MWTVVDAGLASISEIEGTMTLMQYADATEYLQAKQAEERRARQEAQDSMRRRR